MNPEKLSVSTSIDALLNEYPFLEDFLISYNGKFALLKNTMIRATLGKAATIRQAASIAGTDPDILLNAILDEIRKHTGKQDFDVLQKDSKPGTGQDKIGSLKSLIIKLHEGLPFDEAKNRFDSLIKDTAPGEIAQMEEQLISEGMPAGEIQRLCDLHVGVFKTSLEKKDKVDAPAGHPVHTYMADNKIIQDLADEFGKHLSRLKPADNESGVPDAVSHLETILKKLGGINNHYIRKENQLFPFLEKHDVSGPSQVMWGIHDEIRRMLKETGSALKEKRLEDALSTGTSMIRAVTEMIYKENNILYPLAMENLTESEWAEERMGEDELGYVLVQPAAQWPAGSRVIKKTPSVEDGKMDLQTGKLDLEQVNAIFKHLPIDISFVDASGHVQYYSDTKDRLFPRSSAVIGRHVEKCHPPDSVEKVKQIIKAFSEGKKDSAEFWIHLNGRFIYIRYFAVREGGRFLGTLEVSQDITEISRLEGERRLLDWE